MIKRSKEQEILEDCIGIEDDKDGNKIIITMLPADVKENKKKQK